jgi:hypothetical protein
MNLFIQVRDGQPYEYPVFEENMRLLFKDFDPENPPAGFAKFQRIEAPQAKFWEYKVVEGPRFVWDNGVVRDEWALRDMTPEEKAESIASRQLRTVLPKNFDFMIGVTNVGT